MLVCVCDMFILQIVVERLLCVRQYVGSWESGGNDTDINLDPYGTYSRYLYELKEKNLCYF